MFWIQVLPSVLGIGPTPLDACYYIASQTIGPTSDLLYVHSTFPLDLLACLAVRIVDGARRGHFRWRT